MGMNEETGLVFKGSEEQINNVKIGLLLDIFSLQMTILNGLVNKRAEETGEDKKKVMDIYLDGGREEKFSKILQLEKVFGIEIDLKNILEL